MDQIIHLLCAKGRCRVHFLGEDRVLTDGWCIIAMASHLSRIEPESGSAVYTHYLTADGQADCLASTEYGTYGSFYLFMHPMFHVGEAVLELLVHDLNEVCFRASDTPESYRDAAVMQAMRMFYLDVINAHAAMFARNNVPQREILVMSRLIQMLESGAYMDHRSVDYYANALCVTPKYLHKVTTEVSGHTPSYWIQRFTVMGIRHLIRHGGLSPKEVSDMMHFDNVSHFNRYFTTHFGCTPGKIGNK